MRSDRMSKNIKIFDTTLRDGSQSVGINFTVNDKVKIASGIISRGINTNDSLRKSCILSFLGSKGTFLIITTETRRRRAMPQKRSIFPSCFDSYVEMVLKLRS